MTDAFAVYRAGDQIPGTDIGFTHVYMLTPLGKVRMTAAEADCLGRALIAAAESQRRADAEESLS